MRGIAVPLALLGLAAGVPLGAQNAQGAFVVTLGHDTIVIEQYKRSGVSVEGDMLIRSSAAVIQRHYTGTLNANGTMAHFEMTNKNISNPQAPVTKFVVAFGDTTQVDVTRDTAHNTIKVPTPGGALPFINFSYDMYELYGRRAVLSRHDTVATLPLGASEVTKLIARHPAGDSLTVSFENDPPTLFAVNAAGEIQRVDGRFTTQKVRSARLASVDLAALSAAFAARPLGQLSPPDSVKGSVGGAAVLIEYGRPSMRGRVVFGPEGGSPRPVVPYGQVWRTGANFATRFTTSGDLSVGGQTIPAGTYTLWTLPQAGGWKLIFNKQTKAPCADAAACADPKRAKLWGTDYSADSDFVRVDMQVAATAQPIEQFVITLEPQGDNATLAVSWEKTRASVSLAKK